MTIHFFALAALNDLHPFFTIGCILSTAHPVLYATSRRAIAGYAALVAGLVLTTFAFTGRAAIFAYGVPMAGILSFAYGWLGVQLEIERIREQSHDDLERAVATRTKELEAAVEALHKQIHEREKLEEELLVAHKMEALGRLAGGVAHDYNNLLTAILGYAEILGDRFAPGSDERAEAAQVENAAQRAADLTAQLLAFSRASPLGKAILDLNTILSEMSSILRRLLREDIELVVHTDAKPAYVLANRSQLEQIVLNLVINARDAMPEGGHVEIQTREEEGPDQRWIVIRVSDTGRGMDAETRSRVFDPFFTTKGPHEGTGLGLSTVYAIVQQAGGSIRVSSEPERGSQFEIHWPAASAHADAPEPTPSDPAPRGHGRVLVVDDDREIRRIVCRMLEKQGYLAEEADGGSDALMFASEGRFDLVLTDVVMPKMSGLDFVKHLRTTGVDVPVLFMSGQLDHPSLRLGQLPEGSPLIAKPFTSRALAVKVSETLQSRSRA